MGLAPGTKLGPYEVVEPLGAGGMGEVYRARDTRLERSVAIKILPAHLADKPDAAERFEREARAISSLNHPNICQLHDIGLQNGVRYLVMELLEGETLADRLRRGPLPLDQVLRHGAEIARGLAAAHRCDVAHRDLKPGNIMLTKAGAKLMDFGLAKGLSRAVSPSKSQSSELVATMTSSQVTPLTAQGTIVGTFQYMAPEQVEGKESDARTDIFSLGAVLYEMTTGKRAFEGKSLVSVAASILEREPEPIKTLQPLTPPALERVIKKCLAKDPDDRWQSAGDLASELSWIGDSSGSAQVERAAGERHAAPGGWVVATVAIIAALVLAIVLAATRETKPVVRSQIAASDKLQFNFVGDLGGPPVLSPDGKNIVFSAKSVAHSQLFLRPLDQLAPRPLPGTDNATFPFWSPDSHSIGFFADGKLKRIEIAGGPPVIICDAPAGRGASWSSNGTILFSPEFIAALSRVPAAGGTPVPFTKLDPTYTTHRWPWFLPDGEHFLYLAASHSSGSGQNTAIFWSSLDGKQNKLLMNSLSNAIYASGYLLYVHENTFMARPFDPRTGELQGEATVLNDDLQVDGSVWRGTFSASDNGVLLYEPGGVASGTRLTWFDTSGKVIGGVAGPDTYTQVELSPDNKKAAVTIGDPSVIWIFDLMRNTRTRLTFGSGLYRDPAWSADGKQIAYLAAEGPSDHYPKSLMIRSADGSGEEKQAFAFGGDTGLHHDLNAWSHDGRYLLFTQGTLGVGNGMDLWAVPLTGDRKPIVAAGGLGDQMLGQFSPDGRWIAYTSNETGRFEVYVAPFPATGAKWQVSSEGGWIPRWRGDGKAIYFDVPGAAHKMMATVNGQGSSFDVSGVRLLYDANNLAPTIIGERYSITSDGQRILDTTTGEAGTQPLTLIQNWTAEIKKK